MGKPNLQSSLYTAVANVLFALSLTNSFLFASQDAMTSSVIYGFQLMADYPEAFAKVRQEQMEVRGGDVDAPISLDILDKSVYLKAFVKETLRYRREWSVLCLTTRLIIG